MISQYSKIRGSWLRRLLDRIEPPDSLVLVSTALIVGIGTGLLAVLLVQLLTQIGALTRWVQMQLGEVVGLFVVMGAGGLFVGYFVNHWAIEAKGSGIPDVMEAVALHSGRIHPRVVLSKIIASSITIGVGGSAGREGPIVQVGSALGSTVGQWLHLSASRMRMLVACGAAAGVAASFNAPIAGALFALEVILARFSTRYFGAVVISAVAAGIVGRVFWGDQPAFVVPAYPFQPGELPIYIALGILAAFVAVLFVRTLYYMDNVLAKWTLPPAVVAGGGMVLTAVVGLLSPGREVLGSGLVFIGQAIAADFNLPLMLMGSLLLLKIVATGCTLSTGNSGGLFAPSLFVGAILGGGVGTVAHLFWPEVAVNPGAYAIVGMAAVFSGAARAPITAVLIIFEMSNDYKLILPLMLATVISTLLAEHLFQESIYTLKLSAKGINLQQGHDLDLLQSLAVWEAMEKNPYVVSHDMPLDELGRYFQKTHTHSFPVVDDDLKLVGMVSLHDYEQVLGRDDIHSLRVRDIATMGHILTAYDDDPLGTTLQRLAVRSIHKLPVVSRNHPNKIIGVIRRDDIVKAYNLALMRRAKQGTNDQTSRIHRVDDMEFLELEIPEQSRAAYQTLLSLSSDLPHDCVVVFIRRKGSLLIPHGDTVLHPGDVVHAFVRETQEEQLRDCLLCKLVRDEQK